MKRCRPQHNPGIEELVEREDKETSSSNGIERPIGVKKAKEDAFAEESKSQYRSAMREAALKRNALLEEQNQINKQLIELAAEKNRIEMFKARDDELSQAGST